MDIKKKITPKGIYEVLLAAVNGFIDDKCMKMSASLAYYTIFSIGPLLLIIIWCIGVFFGNQEKSATDDIMQEFSEFFGADVAQQAMSMIRKIDLNQKSHIGITIGIITLMISSTTIFIDIQDSLNTIWKVKAKPKKGWLKLIINRLISFSMVLGLGFLLISSLLLNAIIASLTNYLSFIFENLSINMIDWINTGITFLVTTSLFGFIFSFLPDAKVRFKDILGGALFTSLLFMLGRYLITYYLQVTAASSAYGAAGSIIVLLLWIYYSAAILYFGAEFTKEVAHRFGNGIKPSSFAVRVEELEIASTASDKDSKEKL
ncbi:YihY/virulence factor BrkB family protein [Sphingobacteriaceae bacterium WQ 2009]|uniref:YihY/virulence factor BrkB family protein n=1 Tax=Rhinopithecimicrobium faecis TaxID=2820698 RepID=A0A8T4HF45_9SPHI|nr:YihY/virulence factor BrkB family protein [Sphingobacteriaceae bacterium WQ 2009]